MYPGGHDLPLVQVAVVPLGSSENLTYKCGLNDCDPQYESDDTVWPSETTSCYCICMYSVHILFTLKFSVFF